ncbi:hypothetical protein OOT33_02950 [Sphingobium sp. DEHP117]|uniref:hypothetical protein n=1 Tax=Sphingobium sp. DEHP117 TaxID=2993436 RepID=UPI0027D6ED7A|nr:hypothetical protein [Sphingobium sp. DEHP117]MDQ4419396.1 hypothetical protein [Sphingobium sp. DEHP117]
MRRAPVGLAFGSGVVGLCLSVAAFASGEPPQGAKSDSCSIHIWQRSIYRTKSASNLGAFGLVGAVLQDQYDRKYPAASVEGVMEDVLNIKVLPDTIASVSWGSYTGAEKNTLVFEHEAISDSQLKDLKSSMARNSTAQDSCYIELYVGTQTFQGGAIKSHLFSDFYARTFYDDAQTQKGATLWDQTAHLSVKDADSVVTAKQIIADGFVTTLTKFLANKLPKRKMPG